MEESGSHKRTFDQGFGQASISAALQLLDSNLSVQQHPSEVPYFLAYGSYAKKTLDKLCSVIVKYNSMKCGSWKLVLETEDVNNFEPEKQKEPLRRRK